MRIIAFILSLYILVLTAIPCVDVPEDTLRHENVLCQTDAGHHHNEADHCSPFCTCNCCTSPIMYQVPFVLQFDNLSLVQPIFPAYRPGFVSAPLSSIWQPPKIA